MVSRNVKPGHHDFFKEQSVKDYLKLADSEGLRETDFGSEQLLICPDGRPRLAM